MTNDFGFSYEIIKSNKRKTASIEIIGDSVRVIVPERYTESHINNIILKKAQWIKGKLKVTSTLKPPKPKEYVNGESFTLLGKNYRLKLTSGARRNAVISDGYLIVSLPNSNKTRDKTNIIKKTIEEWYKAQALKTLKTKTNRFQNLIGVKANSVSVRSYKLRWGSCCTSGDITYNWRLVIAPHKIVDYVILHELCHLIVPNHSKEFWRKVRSYMPDFNERKLWLKSNSDYLVV